MCFSSFPFPSPSTKQQNNTEKKNTHPVPPRPPNQHPYASNQQVPTRGQAPKKQPPLGSRPITRRPGPRRTLKKGRLSFQPITARALSFLAGRIRHLRSLPRLDSRRTDAGANQRWGDGGDGWEEA